MKACLHIVHIFAYMDFFTTHWAELALAALAFLKVIVNLTPTEDDNAVFGILDRVINALIPDRRK